MLFVIVFVFEILYYILIIIEALEDWSDARQELNEYCFSVKITEDDYSLYEVPTSVEYFNKMNHGDFVFKKKLKYDPKFRELYYKEKEMLLVYLKIYPLAVKKYKPHLIKILGRIDDPVLSDKIASIIFS